tara:strand:- start:151 stop:420 length:270 start_codon:yes stop_codon:yes gene_type:complete
MTLNEIVKIQSIIDNKAIAKDTTETLENNYYYSKSKGINIKFGNMHIDHFLRALKLDKVEKSLNDIQTVEIINKQKETLKKIERLLNEQ